MGDDRLTFLIPFFVSCGRIDLPFIGIWAQETGGGKIFNRRALRYVD